MIEVEFHSPRVQRNRRFVDAEEFLQSYDLHPGGHGLVVTARGKPFVMALWEKAVIQQGQLQGVRYRLATWLQDGIRLAIISDAGGEEALELHYADASNKPVRLSDLDLGRVTGIKSSPTKNVVAITNHRNELIIVDVDEKTATLLDHSRFRPIYGVAWSPDGPLGCLHLLAYPADLNYQTGQSRKRPNLGSDQTRPAGILLLPLIPTGATCIFCHIVTLTRSMIMSTLI